MRRLQAPNGCARPASTHEVHLSEKINAAAPGRVNLIGEHTDYNEGFVLPTVIPQKTQVILHPRTDLKVRMRSSNVEGGNASAEYELGCESRRGDWTDYLQGITAILGRLGLKLRGFEAEISSKIPMGSGLSSSAALEIATLRALRQAFDLTLDDVQLAQIGQRVENEFVGARVGIMDQMAASLAQEGEALFLDTRDLSYRRIKLPLKQMDLLVIDSGISHSNVHGGGYNERRAQCEEACHILGIRSLRELDIRKLYEIKSKLSPLVFQRVRHVVTENDRVLSAVHALEESDLTTLGQLLYASHASMKDDYQVSVHEIDTLVELARSDGRVFGARLTGGGFGGSIVVVTHPHAAAQVAQGIVESYGRITGRKATVLVP